MTSITGNSSSSVGHKPASGKWEFDETVAKCFDDMLKRSIPQYEIMRKAVFALGQRYVQKATAIFDLGCSRGEALAPFVEEFGGRNTYVGCEVSEPMLLACRQRFSREIQEGICFVGDTDLRTDFPVGRPSVVLSVFTLQFVPINYRQSVVQKAYDALRPGGALILVEKLLGADDKLDGVLVDEYHAMKRLNGYSADDVDRKALSLEGVLVPLTAKWNEDMLQNAGFRSVDCFWRWMNFAGWVAVKR